MRRLMSWSRIKNGSKILGIGPVRRLRTASDVPHKPVMAAEVCDFLRPESDQTIVDMTFGAGGHSKHILNECPKIRIVALDRDPVGHEYARKLADEHPGRIVPLLGRFSELPDLLKSVGIKQSSLDGMLFDFGCSSMQFDTPDRGFAISADGPLDMRMDGDRFPEQPTAGDVLKSASEEDLVRIFKVYGEEKLYKKIARGVVESRYLFRTPETTRELGDLVDSLCDGPARYDKLDRPAHNATKIFQALRIFVNDELNEINQGMVIAQHYLKVGGRLVTLSFHSLEDTIVKRHVEGNVVHNVANPLPFRFTSCGTVYDEEDVGEIKDTPWQSLTKHVVLPRAEEIEKNPRSRSAKLRAAQRIK